jgi:hypothetical protein
MVFYAISKPFTAGLYARSKKIADSALDAGEAALREKIKESVIEVENTKTMNKRNP